MEMEELYVILRADGAGQTQILMGEAPMPKEQAAGFADVMNDVDESGWHHYAMADSDDMPDTTTGPYDCLDWMDVD